MWPVSAKASWLGSAAALGSCCDGPHRRARSDSASELIRQAIVEYFDNHPVASHSRMHA
jgi:hypothetical protein